MIKRRPRRKYLNEKGLTLEELMMVMAIVSNLMSFILPGLNGMILSAQLTKAERELQTLKSAVTSYWRNNQYKYPNDITSSIIGADDLVTTALKDPFKTDAVLGTYGYIHGRDPAYGEYFIIYTKGPSRNPTFPSWDSVNGRVVYDGNGLVVSNVDCFRE